MKKIVFIQTGLPVQQALEAFGDFDKWFFDCLDIDQSQFEIYRVFLGEKLPHFDSNISGIIISGSPSMVTNNDEWSIKTKSWLAQFIDSRTPILGVCYGHQLLAQVLGGEVNWNPNGREIGSVSMSLELAATQDPLLSEFAKNNKPLELYASHLQSVISLPPEVTVLGSTSLDEHHCFCYKNHVWGFQFHPEFSAEITQAFIQARSDDIKNEGLDPQQLHKQVNSNSNGKQLLLKFRDLCFAR